VLLPYSLQTGGDALVGFIPPRLDEPSVLSDERMDDPIRVVHELVGRRALGAQGPQAYGVVRVRAQPR
jgi:hypothetical protein